LLPCFLVSPVLSSVICIMRFISFFPSFLLFSVFSSFCQTIVTSDKIQRLLAVEFKSKYLSVESNCTRVCFSLTPGFSQFAVIVRSSAKFYTSFTSVSRLFPIMRGKTAAQALQTKYRFKYYAFRSHSF